LLVSGDGNGVVNRSEKKRVAVRLRLGDDRRADRASGTRAIVDDDLLPQFLRQLGGEGPGEGIRSAAGREGNDQRDGAAGPGLSPQRAG
jgi:hypothetical protein